MKDRPPTCCTYQIHIMRSLKFWFRRSSTIPLKSAVFTLKSPSCTFFSVIFYRPIFYGVVMLGSFALLLEHTQRERETALVYFSNNKQVRPAWSTRYVTIPPCVWELTTHRHSGVSIRSVNDTPLCYRSNNVAQLSRKLRIFAAALIRWNVQHGMRFIAVLVLRASIRFSRRCIRQNDLHVSASSDLDIWPRDLNVALPVTPRVGNPLGKFERRTAFRFRVNGWQGTDGRTDGRRVTRNAAS